MLNIKKKISEDILNEVLKINENAPLTSDDIAAMLEYPPDTTMGDLAFPCFKLSKALRRSPVMIADAISADLHGECIKSAEAVNG